MKKKGESGNKLIRLIIAIPIKALCKARDLYLWSITGCAARSNLTNGIAEAPLPRNRSSKSVGSAGSSRYGRDEDYGDLILAASVRKLGHENEIDMILRQRQNQIASGSENGGRLPKSCSVGMASIDEENASEFGGGGVDRGGEDSRIRDLSCARSKSYAAPSTKSLN